MSDGNEWRNQLMESLELRDKIEKANINMFTSFETLYDRAMQAEETLAKLEATDAQGELQSSLEQNQQLSIELKNSQDNTRELETQLQQQKTERLKSAKEVTMLNRAVTRLTNKLNNQTEEYQHKNKSIELINDEILSLSIQNNLLTDKVDKLEKENGDLVERWIEKVKADADKMNETNAFLEMYGSKNSDP
ncbi:hypothetical protein WICANDRAFT_103173 [Wickerhamomyces anomalus NRRL Y-366-8]|uniref:Autophagy-related protein 16 domain-containing protein n=1 Tax=Wickerhamomyces anomalus (strain ATCC 58044 / CBS 1984 / NCYC 433 / NRRL Y-366-8) TaxID=683960 RepID=A0A1E3PAX6_WICAA|nr:uncharacterized protein WICANDRAFT_103173 [Wickerhamomyces anomalus NRRL Y-366-8]ODQ62384.1 hypothetical protein WICANDRAFT_103173 [Wickerhamomyces anomalus NRRL Y-366-8]